MKQDSSRLAGSFSRQMVMYWTDCADKRRLAQVVQLNKATVDRN